MAMERAFDNAMNSTAEDIHILRNEIAIFKNLIKERKNSLDLVRELLSNAGAREVGATHIDISYMSGAKTSRTLFVRPFISTKAQDIANIVKRLWAE